MRMSFLGLFTFNAPFLPYVIMGIEFLLGNNWSIYDALGIVVGHMYYYLTTVYPGITQRHILKTPDILKRLLDDPNDV